MTESEIRDTFQAYKHPYWGIVGLYQANGEGKDTWTCDNYWTFNALYKRLLNSYGYNLNGKEVTAYCNFFLACEKEFGLISRFPGRGGDISQDEIYGACYTNESLAIPIEIYGSKHLWCYNLEAPGKFKVNYFFARYPSFMAYVKACSGKPIWLSQFYWILGCVASALTSYGETTGKLQTWLMIPQMRKYFIPRLAIMAWCVIMKWRYKNGIKELMNIYFGADHAFTKCSKESWE